MHNGNGRHPEGTCIKVPFSVCVIVAEHLKVVTAFINMLLRPIRKH